MLIVVTLDDSEVRDALEEYMHNTYSIPNKLNLVRMRVVRSDEHSVEVVVEMSDSAHNAYSVKVPSSKIEVDNNDIPF